MNDKNTIKTFRQGITVGETNAGLANALSDGPFSVLPGSYYWDEEETCFTVPIHLDLTLVTLYRPVHGKYLDFRVKYQFLDSRVAHLLDSIWGNLPENDPGFSLFENGVNRILAEANIAVLAVKQWGLERGAPQVEVTYGGFDRASLRKIYEMYENNQFQRSTFGTEDIYAVIHTKNLHTERESLVWA